MDKINAQEPLLQTLSDDALKAKTDHFRRRLKKGASLDDLLVEAFAVVREVSSRVLRLRHFDAQLVWLQALNLLQTENAPTDNQAHTVQANCPGKRSNDDQGHNPSIA